jgi:hypothetical protein
MRIARLLGLVGAAAPSLALACPSCARDTTPGAWLLVAGLIAAPYLVVAGVLHTIRTADRGEP